MIKTFRNVFGFDDKDIDAAARSGSLLSLEIELSSKCNLRCIYCYAGKDLFRSNELEVEEIYDVISQAKALGAKKIIYLGAGEPLLDPKFPDIAEYVHKLKLDHILFTNGTLIDKKTAQFCYDREIAVVITYNSLKPDVYDQLAGCAGAFESMTRGLNFLIEAGYPKESHALGIESIICRQNYDEIPDIWRWARGQGILPYIECLTLKGMAAKRNDLLISKEETKKIFEKLAKIDSEEYGLYWKPHPPIAGFSCRRHLYSCTVNSQGFVIPCVGLDIKMGNIRDDKLSNILEKSPVRGKLLGIKENIKGACRTCEHNAVCYGCRGTAYELTGDYLESDPTCWMVEQ